MEMQMKELGKQWITSEKEYREGEVFVYRQKFTASQVKKAVFYGTALGVYEAELNGVKIGRQMFAPGFSYYPRRVLYQTHEVTELLREGENTLTVYLGQGWYCGRFLCENQTQIYGEQPAVAWILELEDAAGSRKIVSDETVEELESPYEYAGEYDGEIYFADGRENVTGHAAAYTRETPFALEPTLTEVRLQDEMSVRETTVQGDVTILDFGQNFAGIVEIDPSFLKNETITIRHGEILNADGSLYTANLRKAKATIVYHAGAEKKKYRPRFTYMGFRYMELSGAAYQPGMIRAYALHTEMKRTGYFSCENPLVQKLYENQVWGQKSNYVEVPTDCPQREKNGWTGDGHLAIETALYNYDAITVYEKWLADHRDEQQPNGVLPDIIPTGGWGYGTDNGLDWTSTIALIPWNLYLFYGDPAPLEACYENIRRYVDYVDRRSPEGLTSWGRGDWVPVRSRSSLELTSSVYFFVDASILARAAELFGRSEDHARYAALAEKIRTAINRKYYNPQTGLYASGTQTELSVPLLWGVVPEEEIPRVAENLARRVEEAGCHLDVGVLGTRAILDALCRNGHAETAYRVAVQTTYPSWGWWIVNGATTLLENWDLEATRDISDNHMMFGEIGGGFFKALGGIRPDPACPGFRHILLEPHFVGPERFEASHDAPAGRIVSGWERKGSRVTYRVVIPANCTATLHLPDNVKGPRVYELAAGSHTLTLKLSGR